MSRKKVLLASSLTLCSASASLASAGTGKHPTVYADDLALKESVSEQKMVLKDTSNQYLSTISVVATGNVVTKMNEESEPLTYRVKKGDNLFRIGLHFGIHHQDITAYNQLKNPRVIHVGQNLKIPLIPKWLRVEGNESLQSLAEIYQTTTELLKRLNPKVTQVDQSLKDQWVVIVEKAEMLKPVVSSIHLKTKPAKKKRVVKLANHHRNQSPIVSSGHSFIWPVTGVVTSNFGWRNGRIHKGIDIWNVARSNALIRASLGGVVVRAGYSNGYGNLVVIDHGNGFQTYYAHLSRISVSKGQKVSAGEVLGNMGLTGNATGYHLHFEIRKNDQPINPLTILN